MCIRLYRSELDFINLMAYDLNGAWNNYTSHNSPLYPRSEETGEDRYLNVVCFEHALPVQPASPMLPPSSA